MKKAKIEINSEPLQKISGPQGLFMCCSMSKWSSYLIWTCIFKQCHTRVSPADVEPLDVWCKDQVKDLYSVVCSLHDGSPLRFKLYNDSTSNECWLILNFVSFFSPPIFSPTLKQNTPTLGNGFREKKNSVSSPVQRKNGGMSSLL